MAEYIDREVAVNAIKKDVMGGLNYESILKRIPSADVQPVEHGHWIICDRKRYLISCSNCNWINVHGKFDYCPICGATMDGEE